MTIGTDVLYYIMDYSGNYYRTDANNQLVVADKIAASVFSFEDATSKIGDGQKSKFYHMYPVNSLEEKLPYEGTVETDNFYESDITNVPNDSYEENTTVRDLTENELIEDFEKNISEYDLSKLNWDEYLTHFTFVITNITEYRSSLIKAESDVDLKICDVLHYIELCDMGNAEAADLIELLKVLRENRREIKDELLRSEIFQKNVGTSTNLAKTKEALKAIRGLDTRKYTPRKYSELFEGCILNRRQRSKRSECIKTLESIPEDADFDGYNDYVEDHEPMEYIKRDTPFDKKENNWMDYAIKQAEFYKNVRQYMINLKIDIDEIDESIDDLMEEIESTNCNVAQGYKLFKKLKDLRLQKKQKENELECLYILTEHFDISAMVDECERNVDDMTNILGLANSDPSDNKSIIGNIEVNELPAVAV